MKAAMRKRLDETLFNDEKIVATCEAGWGFGNAALALTDERLIMLDNRFMMTTSDAIPLENIMNISSGMTGITVQTAAGEASFNLGPAKQGEMRRFVKAVQEQQRARSKT